MSTSSNDTGDSQAPPDKSTVVLLLGIAGDTTWRMFAPILILGAFGVWGDVSLHTKPWLTISALVIATTLSAVLIKKQLSKGKSR